MNTESLQISLAQKIFSIWDEKLLKKINNIINKENIVGYDADGNAILAEQYLKEMDDLNAEIDNNTAELSSTDEVFKKIKNAYGLD